MSNKITTLSVLAITIFLGLVLCTSFIGCLGNPLESMRNEEPAQSPKINFKTSEGEFTIQLYPENAPQACEKFKKWCEGIEMSNGQMNESLYLGLQFYRVLSGKFIECGDPFNRGQGADTFKFPMEKTYKTMTRGRVCMANDGNGNNSSIFFILLVDNPKLEGKYTVLGEVTKGIETADKISNVPTGEVDKNRPLSPVVIEGVSIVE